MEETVGVVLAAGASERWGGRPKALLEVVGEPALARILRLLERAGILRVRVVLGAHPELVRPAAAGPFVGRVEWIDNPDWALGRTRSIQLGLAGLDERSSPVILWPVDHPMVAATTLPALRAAAEEAPLATWIIPEYRGRGGHPVLLRPEAWRAVFELGPDEPLRALLPRLGPQVLRVPLEDPGVVVNLNTPAEYQSARAEGLPRGEDRWTGS
jgi:molybdenum cofactor cytidylyltransferase